MGWTESKEESQKSRGCVEGPRSTFAIQGSHLNIKHHDTASSLPSRQSLSGAWVPISSEGFEKFAIIVVCQMLLQ